MVEKVFGQDHPGTADARELLAELDLRQGKPAAKEELAAVLKVRQKDDTAKPALLWTRVLLAEAAVRFGDKPAEAAKELARLTAEHAEMYGEKHYRRHAILAVLADAEVKAGNADKAAERLIEALAIRETVFGNEHKLTVSCRERLAQVRKK